MGLVRLGFDLRHVETDFGEMRLYQRRGEGTPVLFLHGFGSSAGPLGVFASGLHRPALVPDLFDGAGGSRRWTTPLGHSPLNPSAQARAIERVLATLGVSEVEVFGVSFGAWIALELAAKSALVSSLFLVAPAGMRRHLTRWKRLERRHAVEGFAPVFEAIAGRNPLFGLPVVRAIGESLVRARFEAAGARELLGSLSDSDTLDDHLSSIRCRTRILAPEADGLLGAEGTIDLVRGLAHTELVADWLEGVSHEVMSEAYTNVELAMRSWLGLRAKKAGAASRVRTALSSKRPQRRIVTEVSQ